MIEFPKAYLFRGVMQSQFLIADIVCYDWRRGPNKVTTVIAYLHRMNFRLIMHISIEIEISKL